MNNTETTILTPIDYHYCSCTKCECNLLTATSSGVCRMCTANEHRRL